jgi:KaiC/GvpD/RAD55 family RecA-like ATPase
MTSGAEKINKVNTNIQNKEQRVILSYPLDLLLNRSCKFSDYEDSINQDLLLDTVITEKSKKIPEGSIENCPIFGSIVLPDDENPGTGNIIIRGKPGTAKSTFAMQIAVTAAQEGNDVVSFYITLEETPDNVFKKCRKFGWDEICTVLKRPYNFEENYELSDNSHFFKKLIPENDKSPKVFISTLTPRNIQYKDENDDSVFLYRYHQLEQLLAAANIYNEQGVSQKVKIVCIDSLNVFGDRLLNRTELFRIFDLFKRYKILGIFAVEEDERYIFSGENKLHGETLEYLADMVISLSFGEDDGYSFRYLEISKSRYQHQAYGKHPFKIFEIDKKQNNAIKPIRAIRVFPSLHYVVYGTDKTGSRSYESQSDITETQSGTPNQSTDERDKFFFDPSMKIYLPNEKITTILIEGPRATYKSTLARDFLMKKLLGETNSAMINHLDNGNTSKSKNISHVMIIRFHDRPSRKRYNNLQPFLVSEECRKNIENNFNCEIDDIWKKFSIETNPDNNLKFENENTKRFLNSYCYEENGGKYRFTELIFKSGYVFPEEFIQIFLETLNQFGQPDRVVIDEIGRIGASYPLLLESKTAGELFLTAFVHIIKNYRINLVITGTTGEFVKSDHVINLTRTLVDTILQTDNINVFGDNYITIKGEGLRSSESLIEIENVPGVILPIEDNLFKIETNKFNGLVGFDVKNIYRPGIDLYMFKENNLHEKYNNELILLLKYAFSYWDKADFKNNDLTIANCTFDGSTSTSFHDSLSLLKGHPIKKTVICTIDEFFSKNPKDLKNMMVPITEELIDEEFEGIQLDEAGDGKVYSLPYYDNILLMVHNSEYDIIEKESKNETHKIRSKDDAVKFVFNDWEDLFNKITAIKENHPSKSAIDYINNTDETLSCLLLDTLFSTIKKSGDNELIKKFNDNHKEGKIELGDIIVDLLEHEKNYSKKETKKHLTFSKNLLALSKIIRMSKKSFVWSGNEENENVNSTQFRKNIKGDVLSPNSIFYICWYSQLRELIDCYPNLASKLRVYCLPGGGFTGDWQIALMKGSVSVNLGYEVLKLLCREEEDYKRFVKGVGLPTHQRFYKGNKLEDNISSRFLAWPGSKLKFDELNNLDKSIIEDLNKELEIYIDAKNIPQIFKLYYIHEKAYKRSNIKNYTALRLSLVALFKQLIVLDSEAEIKEIIINRMTSIFRRFKSIEKEVPK